MEFELDDDPVLAMLGVALVALMTTWGLLLLDVAETREVWDGGLLLVLPPPLLCGWCWCAVACCCC